MDLVIRATVIFFFVFLVTRVVGRRELSSMEPFDVILLVVMGDLVQQGVTQSDYSVTGAVTVISVMAALTVALVEDGRLIEGNMKRERMTVEDLEEEGRQQQVMSLEDMRWAVLETSGQ